MQPFIPSEADMIKDGPQPALQPMGDGTRARSASMETRPGNFPGFDGEDAELAAALALSLMNSEPASQPAGMLCLNISLFGDCSAYLIDFNLKLCRPRRTWQVIPRRQMKSNGRSTRKRIYAGSQLKAQLKLPTVKSTRRAKKLLHPKRLRLTYKQPSMLHKSIPSSLRAISMRLQRRKTILFCIQRFYTRRRDRRSALNCQAWTNSLRPLRCVLLLALDFITNAVNQIQTTDGYHGQLY